MTDMNTATIRVVYTPPMDNYDGFHVYQVLHGDDEVLGGSYNTSDTEAVWNLAFRKALVKGFTHYVRFGSVAEPQIIPASA